MKLYQQACLNYLKSSMFFSKTVSFPPIVPPTKTELALMLREVERLCQPKPRVPIVAAKGKEAELLSLQKTIPWYLIDYVFDPDPIINEAYRMLREAEDALILNRLLPKDAVEYTCSGAYPNSFTLREVADAFSVKVDNIRCELQKRQVGKIRRSIEAAFGKRT